MKDFHSSTNRIENQTLLSAIFHSNKRFLAQAKMEFKINLFSALFFLKQGVFYQEKITLQFNPCLAPKST